MLDALDECRVVATWEVGASDASLEQGVASDDNLFGGDDKAETSRTMPRHITAFDIYVADMKHGAFVGMDGLKVVETAGVETHKSGVCFGLTQQCLAVSMHGDGEVVLLATLTQSADMVDMGVGEQYRCGGEPFLTDELIELGVFVTCLHARVDDGALM